MEGLYSKLYEKYTESKHAADELILYLLSEKERLTAQITDLRQEVAAIRSAKDEEQEKYKRMLIEENRKNKELSGEIEKLQRELSGSLLSSRRTNGSIRRKRRRNSMQEKDVGVALGFSGQHGQNEDILLDKSENTLNNENMLAGAFSNTIQLPCRRRRLDSSENASGVVECLLDLRSSVATRIDDNTQIGTGLESSDKMSQQKDLIFTKANPQDQQAQQSIPNAVLVPFNQRYKLSKQNNCYVDFDKLSCKNPEFLPILDKHPLRYALTAISPVSETYMNQFWLKMIKIDDDSVKTTLDRLEIILTKERLKNILNLPEANHYEGINAYDSEANNEEICRDICELGYDGPLSKTNHFFKTSVCEPWQSLFSIINKCLSPKHTGHERANFNIMSIFHSVALNRHSDFVNFIWKDFFEVVKTKDNNKSAGFLPYQRFTGLIIQSFQISNPGLITQRTDVFHPAVMKSLYISKDKVPNAVSKVIPLVMLNMADQDNYVIKRYKRKFYDGDNLRPAPLTDEELKAAADAPDDDEPPPPQPPQRSAHVMSGNGG